MKNPSQTERQNESVHKTVLLNETIDGLSLKDESIVLDATFGGGGHSLQVFKKFPKAKVIALDQDINAWKKAKDKFSNENKLFFEQANFRELDNVLVKNGIEEVDGIIFDLGLSSDQFENSERGFTFLKDETLLMTMKANPLPDDITAKEIVNSWSEESLADIIYGYGEEQFSRRIAKGIVEARKKADIKTTFDLVKIISDSVPNFYKKGRLHFATKTFQALRIATNDELGALKVGLEKGFKVLKKGGRVAVISFHSLEDRIVKNFFREKSKNNEAKLINKKPIIASKKELIENNRARSAKLRILEKI